MAGRSLRGRPHASDRRWARRYRGSNASAGSRRVRGRVSRVGETLPRSLQDRCANTSTPDQSLSQSTGALKGICYDAPTIGVAVEKKWYSYFVVTDDRVDPADPSPRSMRRRSGFPTLFLTGGQRRHSPPRRPSRPPTSVPCTMQRKSPRPHTGIPPQSGGHAPERTHPLLAGRGEAKSVLVALDAAGVKVADVVEDAVRRDRALDTYERVLLKISRGSSRTDASENKQIEKRLPARRRASRQNRREQQADESRTGRVPRLAGTQTPGRRDVSPRR